MSVSSRSGSSPVTNQSFTNSVNEAFELEEGGDGEDTSFYQNPIIPQHQHTKHFESELENMDKQEQRYGFDLNFVKRFYRLNGILFSKLLSTSSIVFVFLLAFSLLREYVIYNVGLLSSDYYKVLGGLDLPGFWKQTRTAMLLILVIAFVNSTTFYIQKVMTVTFRKILTDAAHRIYFADIRYYQLNVLDKAIDNPDQRMTQDIDKFTSTYCEALPKLLVSPFTIGYYCYQGYKRAGWQGPVGCFVFFVVATIINKLLMSPIVNYVVKQEKREGDFRFLHMLIRVHSESIAFQQASHKEKDKVDDSLKTLMQTQHALYLRQYVLNFFTNFVDYFGAILSYLMIAIPIFTGTYDHTPPIELTSIISANSFILMYLINQFTSLMDLSGKFTDIAGVTHRIAQLFERLKTLEAYWEQQYNSQGCENPSAEVCDQWIQRRRMIQEKSPVSSSLKSQVAPDSRHRPENLLIWTLENLSVDSPKSNESLVTGLTMNFRVGESIIITGHSSAGKSSILRVLSGLWPYGMGKLRHHYPPGPHGVYVCPQRAYLTWGTLREQISFPLYPNANHIDDKLILYYIDKLKLAPVITRAGGLDVPCAWAVYDSLSPGEMQRICLLRIFYHQPVVVVLDEATSALPKEMEEFIYTELKRLDITLISVSHRESLRKYHDKQLIIDSCNGWELISIHDDNRNGQNN